jgi:hypothetical protein
VSGGTPDRTAASMVEFSIVDNGLRIERYGPPQVLDGVGERRAAVLRALDILAPVVRPLALEISFGPLDPETFAVYPEIEIRRLATPAIPAGVANRSEYESSAEIELVDALTADVVARALTPPHPDWDVATIRATVTAARVFETELTIERLPALPVPVVVLDRERWAVGPIDVPGCRREPPVGLLWRQEYGDIVLRIEAFWTLWWQTDLPEYAGLRAVERALDAAGFPQTPA